jgi:hypothetical protein
MLLLYRMQPDRVMMNISSDFDDENANVAKLAEQTDTARERLLIVRAGNPRRRVRDLADLAQTALGNVHHAMGWQVRSMLRHEDNPEWVDHYRETHAEAETTMRKLIDANFAWWGLLPQPKAMIRRIRGWLHR